ncbi:MAG TPA: hypothetical protein VNM72_01845 [Blastocatellia bacterium]|nr:hypothetical protein [Blastocatellia bacterium]
MKQKRSASRSLPGPSFLSALWKRWPGTCILLLVLLAPGFPAQTVKLEPLGPLTDPSVSESVRAVLDERGYRIRLADGSVYCDIWFRREVPVQAKADIPGTLYTEWAESTLIGVISFAQATNDFRGQAIKSGIYTLRYALHPADGNHMGISPYRDFLLLVPVADDRDASAKIPFEQLVKMSARAAGTNHPASLSLTSAEGQKEFPSVTVGEADRVIVAVRLKTTSGADRLVALIVKGIAEQ